jgi:hypothetical protein
MLVINPQFDGLKRSIEEFFTLYVIEDYKTMGEMANKFIRLFDELERLRKTDPANDAFVSMQEFCFTFTKDFENAVESYKAKINCRSEETSAEGDESAG